jgi:predicted acylesterase/phospholipase RssA
MQQLTLCTYKDEEIPPYKRLDQALSLLEEIGLRNPDNKNSETLSLGGAIYKRKWRNSGQLEHLHESLFFYLEAYKRNPEQDMGYAGVNAAFILDLLADRLKIIAARSGSQTGEAERLQREATELRRCMAKEIPMLAAKRNATSKAYDYFDNQFWNQVTMAEIHFGLKNYDEAGRWLAKANALNAKEWEKETLFNQLTHIARLQGIVCPSESELQSDWHPAWQALAHILGEHTGRALANGRGKVGLALSGGGFRASLFHLGVMARLAEMDALRGVEVLSTVSGGSIVGAHYYLEVQKLLQTKPDTEITCEDYIALVGRVQEQFLLGVQKNIRMRAFSNFRNNLRMLFTKNYTRSHRLGELYESELYDRVQDDHAEGEPRTMPELSIQPTGESDQQSFNPNFSNWRRRAKVPVLLLNSTSLNSGHNWQFTAHWMGEPPGLIGGEIDINQRYRRVYYKHAPTDDLKKYRLGHAVAASACVPGLIEPLSIDGLFEGRTLRLIDGGVHDNQGVAGLLDESCTLILCSDACGQMGDLSAPSDDPGNVLLRTTSLLQDRVRESEYLDLRTRLDSRALEGLFFVHTKKELEAVPLDWIGCQDMQSPMPLSDYLTSYNVARDLQEKIAAIRTDLDAFSEVEAYALMASGYLMTKKEFELLQEQHRKAGNPGTWSGYDIDAPCGNWPFRPLEALLGSKPGADKQRADLKKQLKAASKTFFKTWNLTPFLKLMVVILGVVVILDIDNILIGFQMFANNRLSVGGLAVSFVIFVIVLFLPAFKWLFPQEEGRNLVIKISISLLGYILSKAHLGIIDRLFLTRGKLDRLLKL